MAHQFQGVGFTLTIVRQERRFMWGALFFWKVGPSIFSYSANCTKSNLFLNYQIENRKHMNSSKVLNKFNLFKQKNNDLSHKEKALQLDATHQYQRFKKSASLQPYYLSQARLKKITEIYRTLSTDKLRLVSESKSRRNSQLHTPQKKQMLSNNAIGYVNINSFLETTAKGKQKLTIKRERQNQAPTSIAYHAKDDNSVQIMTKIKLLSSKIEDITKYKSDEKFTTQMNKFCETLRSNTDKNAPKDPKEQIVHLLKLLEECCSRRQNIKTATIRRDYLKFEEEFSNVQVELKKKTIRAMLDQKDIEKFQLRMKQAQAELDQLRSKINSKKIDAAMNTQSINCLSQTGNLDSQNILLPTQFINLADNPAINIHEIQRAEETQRQQIDELKKKMQAYAQRHKELLSVVLVLAHEGIDVQKIYSDIISGRTAVSEDEAEKFEHSTTKIRKVQNEIYRHCRKIKMSSSIDADQSIISEADGLSFNYDGKSIEEDVYTVRNEYKCRQELSKQLQNKLRLNFDDFYQEVFDDQQSQQSPNPPTI